MSHQLEMGKHRNRERCNALADIIYGFVQEAVLEVLIAMQEDASAPKAYMPEVEVKLNPAANWSVNSSEEPSIIEEPTQVRRSKKKKGLWVFRRESVRQVVKTSDGVTADDVVYALVGRRMKARRPSALRALKLLVKSGAIRQIDDKYYPLRRRRKPLEQPNVPEQPAATAQEWVVPKEGRPITAALKTTLSEELAA